MKTSELITNFQFKHGNPITDLTIVDNGSTITLILEGVCEKSFNKPSDFNEYILSLNNIYPA